MSATPRRHAREAGTLRCRSAPSPLTRIPSRRPPSLRRKSQSFFRGYGSILPTSLTCLLPLTRAFSARGPDADVVRPSATITLSASISGTSPGAPNRPESDLLCHLQHSVAPDKRISRSCRGVSRRRENSSWGPGWRHWRRLRCRHSMRALVPEY